MLQPSPIKTHHSAGLGSQYITSKPGSGFALSPVHPLDDELEQVENDQGDFPYDNYEAFGEALWNMMGNGYDCADINHENINFTPELACMEALAEERGEENQIYFYHPDHLGSSSFITDASGDAHQHLQSLPFGESFISQRIDWETRYTFSAKEKDKNTGYHYFGARYYDSENSVWLSVDLLADKYPSMSPFMYTAGNPVMLVDPDGKAITDFINSKTGETQHVEDGRDQIVIVNNEDYEKISSFKEKGINKMTFGDYKKYNGIILEGKTVDLEGDLGEITRTVYAEMSGVGTSNTDRQIVAESIVNRKESGLYGKTYSDILSKDQYNAVGTDAYNDPYAYLEGIKENSSYFYKKNESKIKGNWLNAISNSYKAYNNIGSEIGNGVVSYVSPPLKSTHFNSDRNLINITSQISGLKGISGVWKRR